MKRASLIAVGIMMLLSCENGSISKRLTEVDSLVIKEEYDSAYQMVKDIDEQSITRAEDKAHYHLVSVQTGYLVQKPLASADSLLDEVIAYYQKQKNNEKLADAYYYKAINSYNKKEYKESISFYKEAEQIAKSSNNLRQQFKIAEGISFVNGVCGNFDLQLNYSKKTLELAEKIGNKRRIPFSYYRMGVAYLDYGQEDSAFYYFKKIAPYLNYVSEREKPIILSSLGHVLKFTHPQEAKKYLLQSLKYKEYTATYADLADISYDEGNFEEDYQYLKQALSVIDATPKDNIILNLIDYNLKRGKTDSISEMVTQIFEIRDSIDAKLRNDTIKDLQTQFDHEIALKEKDQMITRGILLAVIVLFLLIAFYFWRRHLARVKLLDYQMQIHDCLSQIEILNASGIDAQKEIDELNQQIRDIMDNRAPRLNKGFVLYQDVVANKDISHWTKEDRELFLEYYATTNYRTMQLLKETPRSDKLTSHRLIFLILVEMGKSDLDILRILSITKDGLRTLRFRTKPKE